MLRELQLQYVYDSSENSIVDKLFHPLLHNSILYQRGVGYFTSGWLQLNLKGILSLIERKGKAELITSPHLTASDYDAMERGEQAKEDQAIYEAILLELNALEKQDDHETLPLLAWLVADNLLEVKFAIPKNNIGDFHDKFAIFTDEAGDKVAIHGSYNDSLHANYNGESFSVYCSWVEGQAPYVAKHEERFHKMFSGQNDFFRIYRMHDFIREKLVLITQYTERPYEIGKTQAEPEEELPIRMPSTLQLFDYQKHAIEEWTNNNCRGLFSMATGTGKTITSLAAALGVFKSHKKICLIVSVPFKHLVEQWNQEVRAFGFIPVMSTSRDWLFEANSLIDDYNLGFEEVICFIVTHQSNADEDKFLRLVSKIRNKDSVLFIGDEAHYLGAAYLRNSLHPDIKMRIGLSATPERWRDLDGTQVVTDYFSREVISFGLERAIEEGYLTPYEFFPHYVEMSEEDYREYKRLTIRISQLLQAAKTDPSRREAANVFAAQRANLLNKSEAKIETFLALLRQHIREVGLEHFKHTIVYSPEGKHREILRRVADTGLRVQEIVSSTSNADRKSILQAFDRGDIQVIVAMKCLDEGVNVPATKRAYFLASTSNPRQFVQRRGRILRKAIGKQQAYIHDFVMIPPLDAADDGNTYAQIMKREFARFVEFYLCASNQLAIHSRAFEILERYRLGYLLSLKPEDIYSSLSGELEDHDS
ncbi:MULTISPECIES: DEAD/DEAH box helicase family protein [unclassified Paenibacillus]|uniref:DEAD/DEAH box helicase family protein n=1 Tax=unclassified Paenibacillus TaxID=185978 RepID=UPI001AE3B3BF|nr:MULTISPECIES: DEAD/DEAH box helicase family protein [unclassified Paenibacillus]MBP1154017.1 superfamily II DNA or RNA helicase [Paenibacillus sp. PvP091]MBP1170598.1 superfamily II DNA or RNA helicase [Paenibacillus sp. PvR098]MBP2441626.1 superfamily II DNA or RNA helicase [Paenibacillus sp. PvP052]